VGSSEPSGTHCLYGGSKYASSSGDSYVCTGAPGATGNTGPAGPAGRGSAADWSSSVSYSKGDLVSQNGGLYVALVDSVAAAPISSGSSWAGVTLGTGASPRGYPLTVVSHQAASGSTLYLSPGLSYVNSALNNAQLVALIPATCTPSLTVYSMTGDAASITYSLKSVTFSGGTSYAAGLTLASCSLTSVSTSTATSCTVTGSSISANTLVTIQASGTPGQTGPVITSFSCL
jgi:hypothetical protein